MKKREVEVRNSIIKIQPYELGDYKDIEYHLSFKDQWYNKILYGLEYDEENKTLYVPRGYPLANLQFKNDCEVWFNKKPNKRRKSIFSLNNDPRDKSQVATINYLLARGKYDSLKGESQLAVDLKTGKGKTYCVLAYLKFAKETGMVICKSLVTQWIDATKEHTSLQEDEIYKIQGSKTIEKLLKIKNPKHKLYVASMPTLLSYAKKVGWDKLNELFEHIKVGTKVYDEAHKYFETMLKIDAYTNVYKTIYLSYSMKRSHRKENKVYKKAFLEVPIYGRELTEEEDKYLDAIIVKFDTEPNYNSKNFCSTGYGFSAIKYEKQLFWEESNTEVFLNAIYKTMDIILKRGGKAVFLFSMNNTIKKVKKKLLEKYPDLDIGIYSSITPKAKRKEQLDKNIILSTEKSMGEGIDVDELRYIVMCIPFSSKVMMEQIPGRLRKMEDTTQYYIELSNTGFSAIRNQHNKRRKAMKRLFNTIYYLNI